jgi:Flp pilus assembly protein TadD
MTRNLQAGKSIRFAICGALATALVACAGSGHMAKAGSYAQPSSKADRGIASAERTVRRHPRDAAARTALGGAYLDAGRFASATTTFQDAIALGDSSGSTALRLALAQIGGGQFREAVVLLDQHRDDIAAVDLGLAMALAGETSRGVDILADSIRAGGSTSKLRQNLAYAYALDGRWAEARVMAAQDVPANQLDARLSGWASTIRPEAYQQRVAVLLGVPLRSDEGQPVELALGGQPAVTVEVAAAPAASSELPAIDPVASDPSREFAVAEPAPAPVAAAPAQPATNFASAFGTAPAAVPAPISRPQPVRAAPVKAAAFAQPVRNSSHAIQLGSFSTPQNAQRAIKVLRSRNPELKNFDVKVTAATVRGKNFWRVSATGFNQASATGLCSTVKTRGGACIAYANYRPLPGVSPLRGKAGQQVARR